MRRGTVVWINLEDASPPELSKTRPALYFEFRTERASRHGSGDSAFDPRARDLAVADSSAASFKKAELCHHPRSPAGE